jgi:hypothetical protein
MRLRAVGILSVLAMIAVIAIAPPAGAHGGRPLSARLTGASEIPGPGDPDGVGTASLRINPGHGRICFEIRVSNITLPAAAAHIHQGSVGIAGPIVVTLTPPDASGLSAGCVSASKETVKAISKAPSNYYVNVHTSDFPNGAVRGQLAAGGGSEHGDDSSDISRVRLSGANEVPGPGDPDGTGEAVIAIVPGQNEICFIIIVARIALPATAAHLHQGTAGIAGPVVVTLAPPGASGASAGCVSGLSHDLVTAIGANPGNYYVNVHTTDYPNGAVRGQLSGNGGHDCGDDHGDDLANARRSGGGDGCGDDD